MAAAEQLTAYDADEAAADVKAMAEAEPITAVVGPVRTELHRAWIWLIWMLGLSMSLFHIYTAWQGTLPTLQQRGVHLGFGLALIFLIYNPKRNQAREKQFGLVWTAAALGVLAYLVAEYEVEATVTIPAIVILVLLQVTRYIHLDVGGVPVPDVILSAMGVWASYWVITNEGEFDKFLISGFPAEGMVAGTVGVILVLTAATRAIGLALTFVCTAMLAYALLGDFLAGFLHHGGQTPEAIVTDAFLSPKGIFGIPIGVSATFIFLFMVFAAMLQRTGMERFFTNIALGLAGGRTGGTAKVGVITSVFSGTITGSSVANTVSNGAFTIPMMKKSGYSKEFSGAVEAASSTGGQITPPVMGAAAFIMLQTIGGDIAYADILKAAIIPAALFFTAQYFVIHFVSKKEGITGLPKDALPKVRPLLARQGYLLLPLILIFVVLSSGMTPMRAAFVAVLGTVGLNIVVQAGFFAFGLRGGFAGGVETWKRMPDKLTPRSLADGLVDATKMALPIVAAVAAAGLISGTINNTGLGLKVGDGLIDIGRTMADLMPFGGSEIYFVMFFTMIACLILGMGLPTTANYVVMAVVAAPAIVGLINGTYTDIGLPEAGAGTPAWEYLIIAHMFVFYFGVMADITPPVCLAAFAAAGISGGSPLKTGIQSVRIAASGFIVPYAFVVSPGLLLLGTNYLGISRVVATAFVGTALLGLAIAGYAFSTLSGWERGLLAVAGLTLVHGSVVTDVIGLAVGAAIIARQWTGRDKPEAPSVSPASTQAAG